MKSLLIAALIVAAGAAEADASVVFVDIVGSTAMAEVLSGLRGGWDRSASPKLYPRSAA